MFENKRTGWGGVEYSRLICSWLKVGGVIYGYGPLDAVGFHKWLKKTVIVRMPKYMTYI